MQPGFGRGNQMDFGRNNFFSQPPNRYSTVNPDSEVNPRNFGHQNRGLCDDRRTPGGAGGKDHSENRGYSFSENIEKPRRVNAYSGDSDKRDSANPNFDQIGTYENRSGHARDNENAFGSGNRNYHSVEGNNGRHLIRSGGNFSASRGNDYPNQANSGERIFKRRPAYEMNSSLRSGGRDCDVPYENRGNSNDNSVRSYEDPRLRSNKFGGRTYVSNGVDEANESLNFSRGRGFDGHGGYSQRPATDSGNSRLGGYGRGVPSNRNGGFSGHGSQFNERNGSFGNRLGNRGIGRSTSNFDRDSSSYGFRAETGLTAHQSNFSIQNKGDSDMYGGRFGSGGGFSKGSAEYCHQGGAFGKKMGWNEENAFSGERKFNVGMNARTRDFDHQGPEEEVGQDDVNKPPPSHYVPVDRGIDELYEEDARNADHMERIDNLDESIEMPSGVNVLPLESWMDAGFNGLLLKNLDKCKYTKPRRIQAAVIPLILNEYDVLGHAETGSGKTAAFVLPIINNVIKNPPNVNERYSPIALTVAPTRELVLQLYDHARKLVQGTGVTVAKAYGQYSTLENFAEIGRGCDLLFATPGRLMHFVDEGKIRLKALRYFILDEADQMLEKDQFCNLMYELTRKDDFPSTVKRQTLMFSATFADEVVKFAKDMLKENYVFVTNGKTTAANKHVEQRFLKITESGSDQKLNYLYDLLQEEKEKNNDIGRTLVFVTKKKVTDIVAMYLSDNNIAASSIHGGRGQAEREQALTAFRRGNIKVLVSTDVCARGIDVSDLDHVINFDLPVEWLTYIHRIGRTGRLRRGKATSFVNINDPRDNRLAAELVKICEDAQQEVPEFLRELARGRFYSSCTAPSDGFGSGTQSGFKSGNSNDDSGHGNTFNSGFSANERFVSSGLKTSQLVSNSGGRFEASNEKSNDDLSNNDDWQ